MMRALTPPTHSWPFTPTSITLEEQAFQNLSRFMTCILHYYPCGYFGGSIHVAQIYEIIQAVYQKITLEMVLFGQMILISSSVSWECLREDLVFFQRE